MLGLKNGNNVQRIDFDVTFEGKELDYAIIYDKREHTDQEILDWINKTNNNCNDVADFIFQVSSRKGIICVPAENADILREWIKNKD